MCAQAHWSQSKLHCVVDTKLKVRLSTDKQGITQRLEEVQ